MHRRPAVADPALASFRFRLEAGSETRTRIPRLVVTPLPRVA
jgi:hypothetical protein